VLAVARRKGVTLVTLSAFDMWGASGFLAKVFAPFAAHGISVDLIATSQYAVSVTLDHIPDGVTGEPFRRVCAALSRICATTVRHPCAVVSVVGRGLRNALPALGGSMSVLAGVPVHMLSEAAEDLNLSFVVDEPHADALVADLHTALLESQAIAADPQFGPVWTEMPCGKTALP
jgi:diaminopimelate decarboxylase/aspartate kinase